MKQFKISRPLPLTVYEYLRDIHTAHSRMYTKIRVVVEIPTEIMLMLKRAMVLQKKSCFSRLGHEI